MDTWTPITPPPDGCVISVDATGRETTITGPRAIMERILDLPTLHYIEYGGLIRASLADPIPHMGAQAANAAVRTARGGARL